MSKREHDVEAMCPLQNLAGVDVDDPVAPPPAASIGDATISSVGHRPSSIVAPNRDQQFRIGNAGAGQRAEPSGPTPQVARPLWCRQFRIDPARTSQQVRPVADDNREIEIRRRRFPPLPARARNASEYE